MVYFLTSLKTYTIHPMMWPFPCFFTHIPIKYPGTLYYILYHFQVYLVFLAGVGFAVVMIFFNRYLATKIGEYNRGMMKHKDSRVKVRWFTNPLYWQVVSISCLYLYNIQLYKM